MIRMHLTAIAIAIVVDTALILALGFTVLDGASGTASSLAGLGIGISGQCVGYGIALYRLAKGAR